MRAPSLLSLAVLAGPLLGCVAFADEPVDECENLARAVEPEQTIEASYLVKYALRSGNCGELELRAAVMPGIGITIQTFADFEVQSQVISNGCTAHLSQSVSTRPSGTLSLQIDGELIADTTRTLHGTVSVQRFASSGGATCTGLYDAQLERQIVQGGAAR